MFIKNLVLWVCGWLFYVFGHKVGGKVKDVWCWETVRWLRGVKFF